MNQILFSITILASDNYENKTIEIKYLLCSIPFHNDAFSLSCLQNSLHPFLYSGALCLFQKAQTHFQPGCNICNSAHCAQESYQLQKPCEAGAAWILSAYTVYVLLQYQCLEWPKRNRNIAAILNHV